MNKEKKLYTKKTKEKSKEKNSNNSDQVSVIVTFSFFLVFNCMNFLITKYKKIEEVRITIIFLKSGILTVTVKYAY